MLEQGYDIEAQVLRTLMKQGVGQKYITMLTADDFTDQNNKNIFSAIQALCAADMGINMATLSEILKKMFGNDDDIQTAIGYCANYISAEFAINEQIQLMKQNTLRRKARNIINQASAELNDDSNDLNDTIASLSTELRKLLADNDVSDVMSLEQVLINAMTELEERSKGHRKGMSSGIPSLDAKTAGFHKGELTIIGARPAVGKSALAAQICISSAKNGAKVLVCSREMTDIQYGIRMLARGTNLNSGKLRSGEFTDYEWEQIGDSMLANAGLDIRFTFNLKYIEDLRRKVEEMTDLDMVVVDYAQLLQSRRRFEKDYLRLGYISKALKDISTDCNVAVIALAQVGRSADGDMPTLAELRGSGDFEQDADNVIFMHRPMTDSDEWVRPDDKGLFNGLKMNNWQYIVLKIAKQRQGETGETAVSFHPESMEFFNIDRR